MANKKQQKRRQERRKGSAEEPAESVDAAEESPAPRPAAGGANPERREQKDAVRQQKERELRRIQRNEVLRKVLVGGVVVAIVIAAVVIIQSQQKKKTAEVDQKVAAASTAAKAAGCSPIETVEPYGPTEEEDSIHVPDMPTLDTYKSIPPVSGPHDQATETAGVKTEPPLLGSVIHSLEHGAVAIWYQPGAQSGAEFQDIKDFVERNQDHVILAPYDYPDEGEGGSLPADTKMVLSAWHHQQTCKELSEPVVVAFLSQYRTPPVGGGEYKGDAPEQNVLI